MASTDCSSVTLRHPSVGIAIEGLKPFPVLASTQRPDAALSITVEIIESTERHVRARAVLVNTGTKAVRISGIRWTHDVWGSKPAALLFPPWLQPHQHCCENYRGDYFGTGTTEGDRFCYPLTNQTVDFGHSEESLFPAMFFFSATTPAGLFIAQLDQERFRFMIRLKGKVMAQDRWLFELEERVAGVADLEIKPGEALRGEPLLFLATNTNDPQLAAREYAALNPLPGRPDNPLHDQRIYCSWNYDFFAEIDEEKMLGQIPLLKKHFPGVKFLQIDDGYQTQHSPGQRAMIDLCYGDLESPVDRKRFPDGPKAFCDKVKAQGLRPAIWLGLWASQGSRMLKDHPDWILRDESGDALIFSGWYGGTVILDPSIQAVRDYLHRMCRTVFQEWGFEGVKLDFSSFAFNMPRVRFAEPGRTGVELRHELESIFRTYLPKDGFFGWCVVCGTAQPFLKQADYFRCAVDIGTGDWGTARRVAFWCANTNVLLQQRSCLPNMDSIGWSKDFNEAGWLTWLNLCAVNGGALEISGDLRKLPKDRLETLGRAMAMSNTRRQVRCVDWTHEKMEQPPSLWLAENPEGGGGLLGIFNWADQAVSIPIVPELQGLPGPFRNAWTRRQTYRSGLPKTLRLPGQTSLLLEFGSAAT